MKPFVAMLVLTWWVCSRPPIAVLEARAITTFWEGDCPGAPRPALVRLTPRGLLLGLEGDRPIVGDVNALRLMLKRAKRERPDLEVLYAEVDDGVPFEQLANVIDVATGAGLLHVGLGLHPGGPRLTREQWTRPVGDDTSPSPAMPVGP